ncbi:MAG: hypothetical protein ACLUVY_04265 [Bacteroides uniformis]
MAAFIILAVVILPCAVACWWWLTDWQAIEEENKRYYTAEGHHIYYDRNRLRYFKKEKLKAKSVAAEEYNYQPGYRPNH